MSGPSFDSVSVCFFSALRLQVWGSCSFEGASEFLGSRPPLLSEGAVFWHPEGRLPDAALEAAPFARICLAKEPSYDDAVRWLRAGGVDYWPLPLLSSAELARKWQALTLQAGADGANRFSRTLGSRLDGLTGLPGLEVLERDLDLLSARPPGAGEAVCFFIDVDRFKHLNDQVGHLAGSSALRRIARLLKSALRGGDRLYRYGGDEFVVLLDQASRSDAVLIAERLRETIERDPGEEGGAQTISVGVAFGCGREVLRRADEALYRAKLCARNQVCVADFEEVGLKRRAALPEGSSSEIGGNETIHAGASP